MVPVEYSELGTELEVERPEETVSATVADRVFSLAAKRKPADAATPLPTPEVALVDTARSEITHSYARASPTTPTDLTGRNTAKAWLTLS